MGLFLTTLLFLSSPTTSESGVLIENNAKYFKSLTVTYKHKVSNHKTTEQQTTIYSNVPIKIIKTYKKSN